MDEIQPFYYDLLTINIISLNSAGWIKKFNAWGKSLVYKNKIKKALMLVLIKFRVKMAIQIHDGAEHKTNL